VLDAVGKQPRLLVRFLPSASAALTSLALFAAFVGVAGISGIDMLQSKSVASCLSAA